MKFIWRCLFLILSLLFLSISCSDDSSDSFLLGDWNVVRISSGNELFDSADEEAVTITFVTNVNFSGMTNANTFSGNYALNGTILEINAFVTTEAAEAGFGAQFFAALESGRQEESNTIEFTFEINDNRLILESASSILTLERI